MAALTRRTAVALFLAGAAACAACAGPSTPAPSRSVPPPASSRAGSDGADMRTPSTSMPLPSLDRLGALRMPALGDVDALVDRGEIRVLVTAGRTQYQAGPDGQHGTVVDAGQSIQQALRDRLGARAAALTVECIPVAGSDVERALVEGRGDMALAWFGPTTESAEGIARSAPALGDLREVAVTGPGVPPLVSLEDLAGRDLFVVEGGRHDESLQRLNARLAEMGKPVFALVRIAAPLEDEDLLEMVNAGLIPATIVDSHVAAAWRLRLPNIAINEDVAVSQDAAFAWAVRSGATALLALVNA